MVNDSDSPAVILEFQPVLRREWLPPHPQVPPQPQTPQAQRISSSVPLTIDFDIASSGWIVDKAGARRKILGGQTIRATFWDLPRTGAWFDAAASPTSRERLVFVLRRIKRGSTAPMFPLLPNQRLLERQSLPRSHCSAQVSPAWARDGGAIVVRATNTVIAQSAARVSTAFAVQTHTTCRRQP